MAEKKTQAEPRINRLEPGQKRLLFHAAAVLSIFIAGLIAYSTSLQVPFLFDDRMNIADNPYIRVTRLSTSQLKSAAVQDQNQLRLFSNLTFGLDYYFHRLNLHWLHAENVALHGLSGVLLYFLIFSLIPVAGSGIAHKTRFAASLLSALIWLAHPAHTQAVTYLVQRQTVLATLGVLGTLLFYIRGRMTSRFILAILFYCLSGLFLIVAVLSKEIGFTAPAFVVMYELMFAGREGAPEKNRGFLIGALFALGLLAISAAIALFKTGILASYLETYDQLGYGPLDRLFTEGRIIVRYLAVMAFPDPRLLALDHEVLVSRSLFDPGTTLPALLLILLVAAGSLIMFRRRPVFAFCGLGFLIALAPESSLIPIELMNDHRIYLPSLFIIPALVSGAVIRLGPRRAAPLLIICVFLLMTITVNRNRVWQSEIGIWRDSASKSPGRARPWSNLCAALVAKDIEQKMVIESGRAIPYCEKAIALGADDALPLVNMAVAYWLIKNTDKARELFIEAAEKYPGSALAHLNYGRLLETTGKNGLGPDLAAALSEYDRALAADAPTERAYHYEARLRKMVVLYQLGRQAEAGAEFNRLNENFPDLRAQIKSAYPGAVSPASP